MEFIDTHCHIHSLNYGLDPEEVILTAKEYQVTRAICVGTDLPDSILAIDFAQKHDNIYASIGIHPHEAKDYVKNQTKLEEFASLAEKDKVVAVGECGLDYFYEHSNKEDQKELLRFQLKLAKKHNLPLIFHVREAFEDFWPILDEFDGIRGVIHSFTARTGDLEQILARGLYVGLNGITTFTKKNHQLDAIKAVPLDGMLLETDAPFLTPVPFRGTIAQLKHVTNIADFLAKLRNESIETISESTTKNALSLFHIK